MHCTVGKRFVVTEFYLSYFIFNNNNIKTLCILKSHGTLDLYIITTKYFVIVEYISGFVKICKRYFFDIYFSILTLKYHYLCFYSLLIDNKTQKINLMK